MLKRATDLFRVSTLCLMVWITALATLLPATSFSQEKPEDNFNDQSLKLRTALSNDPAIGAPLDSLVKLYQDADREEELIALYKTHIEEWPTDPKAKAVLVRILTKLEHREADETIQLAVQQHPEFAHLQYLLSTNLRKKNINLSLEALSLAIDLETDKTRRSRWLGELLELSKSEKGRELATYQMNKLLKVEGQTGQTMLSLGKVMYQHQFWDLSRTALLRALPTRLSAEDRLETTVLIAKAEVALGMNELAGQRLDATIARLAPDHSRRSEIMSLRISVIASDEERNRMLSKKKATYLENKSSEIAILDYSDLLVAIGNRAEAIRITKEGSISVPNSIALEKQALSLIEKGTDRTILVDFLTQKLEDQEERIDLRYRLVKAHFEANDTYSANQDWGVVLAALEGDNKKRSELTLDLARYLRSINQPQSANRQYKHFLTIQPTRLDVTRELCEGYLKNGLVQQIKNVLNDTSSKNSPIEYLLDLSHFLIDEQFFGPAEKILSEYQANTTVPSFEVGLALARVQSELGQRNSADTSIGQLRKQADTPARYKQWLDVALVVNDNFGSSPIFFEREQGRFAFIKDQWTVDRIDNFLYLCESGEQRQFAKKVTDAIRSRIDDDQINNDLRVKLRRMLVRTLEKKSDSLDEIETQFKMLTTEDPDRKDDYRLRRALLHYNGNRYDFASELLPEIDLQNISSAKLLRDSYRMLQEFSNRDLARNALEMVTKLDPTDLFTWERRLSLLAAEGNEEGFREAIRDLLQGVAQRGKGTTWRNDSREALQNHLIDSYWRSIASILAEEDDSTANCIPLLDAVQREAKGEILLWVEWTRVLVFDRLERKQEKLAAIDQLKQQLATNPSQSLDFPDGLSIPLSEVIKQLNLTNQDDTEERSPAVLPLLDQPEISWAFELDSGVNLLRMRLLKDSIIALDDRGQVYRVDAASGKLIWKKSLGIPTTPKANSGGELSAINTSRKARQMLAVEDNYFVLLFGDELRAYDTEAAEPIWKARINKPQSPIEFAYDSSSKQIIVFDSLAGWLSGFSSTTGKLSWEKELPVSDKQSQKLTPLNTGLTVDNGRICVSGEFGGIYNAKTGNAQWSFGANQVRSFPVLLREQRDNLSDQEIATLEQIRGTSAWVPKHTNGEKTYLNHMTQGSEDFDTKVMSFLDHPGSLMAPAVEWSENRKRTGDIAHAELTGDSLWLMDNSGLKYISLELPLGARQYKVSGAWLGGTDGHAWVLGSESLYHVNVKKNLVSIYPINTLGTQVNGTIVGNWLYLRGSTGVAVYNVLSGKQIAGSMWPKEMVEYLNGVTDKPTAALAWQGCIKRSAPGFPTVCYPNSDLAAAGKYFTVLGGNRIVAISD